MTKNHNIGPSGDAPILVEVTRGGVMESRHAVDAVIVDTDGGIVEHWGEVTHGVFPRSACKPLQALPLVETGAADAFQLDDKHISFACASHNGEPIHVQTALAWVAKLGLSDDDFECGAHLPGNPEILSEFVRSGESLKQAHNNCSGKHSGMLTHAVHLGESPKGYVNAGHGVQKRIKQAMAEMYDISLDDVATGIDGCSIPTMAVPLQAMGRAMARLANPDQEAPARAAACNRIARAMMAEPYMVAGKERCCTDLMQAARGKVVCKTGAEGVYMAGLPGKGLGIAIKTRDGNSRATELALMAILMRLEVLDDAAQRDLQKYIHPELHNVNRRLVGDLHALAWSDRAAF